MKKATRTRTMTDSEHDIHALVRAMMKATKRAMHSGVPYEELRDLAPWDLLKKYPAERKAGGRG